MKLILENTAQTPEENASEQAHKQSLSAPVRALAQQREVLNALCKQYCKRIASYLSHPSQANHINTAAMSRDMNARARAGGTPPPDTATPEQLQQAYHQHLTAPNHPHRPGEHPVDHPQHVTVDKDDSGYRMARSPVSYRVNIEERPIENRVVIYIAIDKTLTNNHVSWMRAMTMTHLEDDLKHLFGADNITKFEISKAESNDYPTGNSSTSYFVCSASFRLRALSPHVLYSPSKNAKIIAKQVDTLAHIGHTSNNDVMKKLVKKLVDTGVIKESQDNPSLTSLMESIKQKTSAKQYVISCYLTEYATDPMYMTDQSEWTSNLSEAYITDEDEALDLVWQMKVVKRIHSGNIIKI